MRVLAVLIILGLPCAAAAIPCFPGAEGFGTQTPGGRGGRVIAVTSLADSGPGTLREACLTEGPRTVVFRISGYVRLKKALRIREPFITIAGQTAPGKGICLRDAVLSVETHDVVIRFIRVRVGASLNEKPDAQNCLEIGGDDAYNVVIDHCSFSWGIDENAGIVSRAHDVTFSYNIVSEALRQPFTETKIGEARSHSMALILGNYPDRCSVHHNLLAHCNSRNPRIQGGTHDFVNNVIYDWGFGTGFFSRNPNVNFVGNYYRPGPASRPMKAIMAGGDDQGRIYVKGNRTPDRTVDDLPEWEPITDLDPSKHRAAEPFPTALITVTDADEAYEDVMNRAGCRVPALDEADARVLRQVYMRTGTKIDRPEDVGGYPDLPIRYAPPDSDSDGMPDAYESARGLNPADPRDAARPSRDGYTNLEDYLDSLVEERMNEPARMITYPVPDAVTDCPYAVAVAGKTVPIEQGGTIQGAYYARFQFTGTVRATVAVKARGKAELVLKPEAFRENVASGERDLSFDVSQPGPRVITAKADGKELWPLIVIAEEYDPAPEPAKGSNVFNVSDYGASSQGVQTAAIQRALDACAARPGGGTVYFGPGIYHTGTIRIGDNTRVYLAPGALIVGSTDPADYPVDPGRIERGSHGPTASNSRLVHFDHCRNSSLCGYGVIEGVGHIVRNKHGRHVQMVDVTASKNVRIENVVLRNSPGWTVHILGCDKVHVHNLKIINDYSVGNTDGVNPDSSRNVYITRFFGHCGDDAIAVKTTGNSGILRPSVNIEVRDCIVMTRKTAYKIGTETYADISDVLFANCEAVNCSRGIGLWMQDGSTISDVTYRDIKLDLHEIPTEKLSGEPIRAVIGDRTGVGKIRNILFDRVSSSSPYRCHLVGMPESKLEDFKFWGCRFAVRPREHKVEKQPLMPVRHARDFEFKHTFVEWQGADFQNWEGFLSKEDAEDVRVQDLQETGLR